VKRPGERLKSPAEKKGKVFPCRRKKTVYGKDPVATACSLAGSMIQGSEQGEDYQTRRHAAGRDALKSHIQSVRPDVIGTGERQKYNIERSFYNENQEGVPGRRPEGDIFNRLKAARLRLYSCDLGSDYRGRKNDREGQK